MTDAVFVDGSRYVSSGDAAQHVDLSRDYIARLCRDGKVRGRLFGKNWYVDENSLGTFLEEQARAREQRSAELREAYERNAARKNAPSRATTHEMLSRAFTARAPQSLHDYLSKQEERSTRASEVIQKLSAATLAVALTFGVTALAISGSLPAVSANAENAAVAAFADPSGFLSSIGNNAAALAGALGTRINDVLFGAEFRAANDNSNTRVAIAGNIPSISPPTSRVGAATSAATTSVAASLPFSARARTIVEQPIIQRVVEQLPTPAPAQLVSANFVTRDELDSNISALGNSLRQLIFQNVSAPNSLPASGGYGNEIAASQVINNLSNTAITNPTITGGSISGVNINASSLSGVVSVGSGGSGTSTTPSYGQLLVGNAAGTYTLTATSSLGISGGSGSPGGADSQVQFNQNGAFAGSSAFTFSTSTNLLSVTNATIANATSTNFFATNASTTNATSTALFATLGHFATAIIDAITNLTATNLVAVNGTTTNLIATNATSTNLAVTGTATTSFGGGVSATAFNLTGSATSTATNGFNIAAGCFAVNGTCISGAGGGVSLSAANTWTALQLFSAGASSSQLSVFTKSYFGGTATTTIDSAGNVAVAGTLNVAGNATLASATTTNLFSTTASSTNLFSQTATFGSLTLGTAFGISSGGTNATSFTSGKPLAFDGTRFVSTSTLSSVYGGTGFSSYSPGDILYADSSGNLTKLGIGGTGTVLKVSGGFPAWGTDLTGGGGGGTGFFATTSDSLAIHPTDTSYVTLLGATATSTTGNIFELLGNSLFRGNLVAHNTVTASQFTATSTTASTFPYASSTALTVSGNTYLNLLNVTGNTTLANATSTDLFSTTASSTNLFASTAQLGALTLLSALPVASGGTGATSASAARSNLSAAASGANGDITALSGLTTALSVPQGGTGWSTINSGTLLYGNGSSALATTTAGTAGNILALLNGVPTWTATTTLSTISGTLAVANGGTGSTTLSGLLKGNGTSQVATAIAGTDYVAPATTITAGSGLSGGGDLSTNRTLSLNLGNANTWTGLQLFSAGASSTTFSNFGTAYFGGSSTSSFSSTGVLTLGTALGVGSGGTGLSSVTGGDLLYANAANSLTRLASTTGGGFLSESFTTGFPAWSATSSLGIALSDTSGMLAINRGGTNATSFSTGQPLAFDGTRFVSTSTLAVAYGGTGASTFTSGNVLLGNGAGAFNTVARGNLSETGSAILTITGGSNAVLGGNATIQVAQANGSTNGFLTSTDWTTFNNKVSSTSLSGASVISYTSGTGVISTTPGTFAGSGTYTFSHSQSAATGTPLALINPNSATTTSTQLKFQQNDITAATTSASITSILQQNFNTGKGDLLFSTLNNGLLTEGLRLTSAGNFGIGTSSPGSLLSLNSIANFTTATSTFYGTGGVNLAAGCFAIGGNCLTLGSFSGTLGVSNGGTGAATFGQGWIYSTGGTTALAASTSPTVNYVVATSTSIASQLPYASSTALSISGTSYLGTVGSGLWNGTAIGNTYGGTGQNSSAWTGVPVVDAGVWSASSTLNVYRGGTGQATLSAGDILLGNGVSGILSTSTLAINKGGTGAATLTGLLQGNGASAVTGITGTAGQFPYFNGTNTLLATSTLFLATSGNVGIGTTTPGSLLSLNSIANFTTATSTFYSIGGVNLTSGCFAINGTCVGGAGGAVSSVSNSDGTLTISPTTGAVVASLALGHGNSWTGLQQFSNASTTLFSAYGPAYFGGSATSSFATNGALTLTNALTYGGVTLSNAVTGTGNMVLSASPTFTGTIAGASQTLSGTLGVTGLSTLGQASTTLFSSYGPAYFGGSSTSSFSSSGALTLASALAIASGGTNATSYTGGQLLSYDGTRFVSTSTIGNNQLANATIALSDANSTLTIGGTPASLGGTLTATLNLAHGNTFTALQQFNAGASTTVGSFSNGLSTTTIAGNATSTFGAGVKAPCFSIDGTTCLATSATGANPTATIGLSAVNGSATTFLRSDAAPALSQSITPTWTGLHIFNGGASTTLFSSYGPAYFGGSATSSFSSTGVLTLGTALALGSGGTGATTQQGALNAVAPTPTRAGDIIYYNGSNWVNFAGNNSGTNCYSENSSGVPAWTACSGGGSQTPWTQAIEGGGFALNDAGKVTATSFTATSTSAASSFQNASTTLFSSYGPAYFGATATSSFGTNGSLTLTNALTYGGVTLSNAVTGTGNMVLSASPTFTGSINFPGSGIWNSSGNVGIGTTTPYSLLTLWGGSTGNALEVVSSASAASTTLSTFSNKGVFSIGADSGYSSGIFSVDASSSTTTISNLSIGNLVFDTDAGIVNLSDIPVDSNAASGVQQAQIINIGGTPVLTVSGIANGSGGVGGLGVGIGTTTPYAPLEVWGPDTASTTAFLVSNSASTTVFAVYDSGNSTYSGSIFQSSDQRLKSNVKTLDASSSLAQLLALKPVSYIRTDLPDQGMNLGFLAQDVQKIFPELVSTTSPTTLTPNGTLSLNYTGLIAPIVKALQEISSIAGAFRDNLVQWLGSATNGLPKVTADQLCARRSDGTPVCVTGDQLAAMLNESVPGAPPSAESPARSSPAPSNSTPGTPPIIQIQGDNPASIHVGDTYADLGATISGPQPDLNLGITTYVNGAAMNTVKIDTTEVATDTIDYVVTDQSGLTSTSTRIVIIEPAQPPSTAPDQAPLTTPISSSASSSTSSSQITSTTTSTLTAGAATTTTL